MELKQYQRQTLSDLEQYITVLNNSNDLSKAYEEYWLDKGVALNSIDTAFLHPYVNSVKGVPRVTLKVPTAGGKTFIACNAIKTITDNLKTGFQNKVVAWFVPSDTILKQTLKNLQDVSHPYRQRIDALFNHHVIVVDKESALVGKGISTANMIDNLVILVLSAQSFIETIKVKDKTNEEQTKPRAFRQNGNFLEHARMYANQKMIEGADPTALIQVIAQQNPIVIVDESHNFKADLRVELLNNLSPRFILELTATPRENSNIISFVDAMLLKKENMVKLPVIVENRKSRQDVLVNAIRMRNSLEKHAQDMEKKGGKYIRPIVLFQAQTKTNEDNVTFEKIKESLLKLHIAEDQIKIKTAQIDELKGVDLLSKDCPVRYIITVNALKEGWDCPFAYILATLANRTSAVDVEQILGRVLRQPHTTRHSNDLLNLSYVFTNSMDFRQTVEKIILSLEKTGFSRRDFREAETHAPTSPQPTTSSLFQDSTPSDVQEGDEADDDIISISDEEAEKLRNEIDSAPTENGDIEKLQNEAKEISKEYDKEVEKTAESEDTNPLAAIMPITNQYKISQPYQDVAANMQLPIFYTKTHPSLFSDDEWVPLEKEMLTEGFDLPSKDATMNFEFYRPQGVAIDIEKSGDDYVPMLRSNNEALEYIRKQYIDKDAKGKKTFLASQISKLIKLDNVPEDAIRTYVAKAIENLDSDKVVDLFDKLDETTIIIQRKIVSLLKEYQEQVFYTWLDVGRIQLREHFTFAEKVTFAKKELVGISKGLYVKEETVNNFEYNVISAIASKRNVFFWHRNPEKTGFCINGFINHYPDIIVRMTSGTTVLVETKGDYLDNDDSRDKIRLGRKWADLAGQSYKYFMVFENKKVNDAINVQQFLQYLDDL